MEVNTNENINQNSRCGSNSALAATSATQAHDQVPGAKQQQPIVLQGGTLHTLPKAP
ncbi:hypothetical protein [Idiomarina sp. OT37-5b]|uniref:hypothetical protein n=1 Tax=Idiomarina sp. OT37-5b TaxID=2100422 RepID=UPI0021CB3AC2|nr:hypothetical protein [Idiomarina sp. OT37-5b]